MVCKTLSLSLSLSLFGCEKKAKRWRVVRLHTRAYGTSNRGTQRTLQIHLDELKNSTDRLTESETPKRSVSVQ